MKQVYLGILIGIWVILMFIMGIRYTDLEYLRKSKKYRKPSVEAKLDIIISSAFWDNKWFLINDSLSFIAKSVTNDSVWISDYLQAGDRLVKRENSDTLYILRGHALRKFILIRE